jgi:hypothetical protein
MLISGEHATRLWIALPPPPIRFVLPPWMHGTTARAFTARISGLRSIGASR